MLAVIAASALIQSGSTRIETPDYVYSTSGDGVLEWIDRRTGAALDLGKTPEIEIETGDRPESPVKMVLKPTSPLHYESVDGRLSAEVRLVADDKWPILHKFVRIANTGSSPIRLLNLVLGRIPIGTHKTEGGERGFPLYIDGQFVLSLAHPAGFAHVEGKDVVLRQYPGVTLQPGNRFASMEAVYGVAPKNGARKLFVDYVKSRMIRVRRHHRPYAILESFGGQPEGNFKEDFIEGVSASYLLRNLDDVADAELTNRVQFDYYSIEFWNDRAGDLTQFNPKNFPNGFTPVKQKISSEGMKPGLWIDSGGVAPWSIDLNPATRPSYTIRPGVGSFCRASEPIASMYRDAFRTQILTNNVGLLKFDNLAGECVNPAHNHLPGPLYSTEAIYNSVIRFLADIHSTDPSVLVMLYWGYRSPWWLEYGDTYFECGDHIEAASPAQYPTPYARDAVTQRLDQAQLKITDTPWLGKDSLGIWLSDWTWNSGIGKSRWQEGLVMDLARGSLLLQLWTDTDFLTPPERSQLATFIDLLKANPDCFENSRFFLGDPNRAGPYGYCCSNGKRAFLAIDNAGLKDAAFPLEDWRKYGLKNGAYDVYRWYPEPAKLTGSAMAFRPYEVALIEIVPAGSKPSLGRQFEIDDSRGRFAEASRKLPVAINVGGHRQEGGSEWTDLKPASAKSSGGAALAVRHDRSIVASGANPDRDVYTVTAEVGSSAITGLMIEALPDSALPANGPGRAVDGNFAITDVTVESAAKNSPQSWERSRIASVEADFSQTTFGGWPAGAMADEDPKSGWSIHPRVGQAHAAVLRFDHPIRYPQGGILHVRITNGEKGHSLGRFRLSITKTAESGLPPDYRPGPIRIGATLPPTATGGLLLLVGGSPDDALKATAEGQSVDLTSVWAKRSSWPCPWTAWRAEIGPSNKPRPLAIELAQQGARVNAKFNVYFLPK